MFPRALHLAVPLCVLGIIATPARAAERYAFLVGVKQYDPTQLNDLLFPEDDVTGLSSVLEEAGYDKANLVLMTQSLGARSTRFAPFAKNIRKQLDLLLAEVKAGDSLLVAFSGHGVQLADDPENYFCPADANLSDVSTLIPLGEVYKSLEKSKAAVKVLLVDACRNEPISKVGKARRVVDLETLSKLRPPEPPGGVAAFFSCARGEQSFEHPDLKHGIFFNFVIQGLNGQADLDKDREVSLAELEQYTTKEVQRYARLKLDSRQTPERRGEARGLLTLASVVRPSAPPQADVPRVGQPFVNSIGMRLASIPPGEFQMGSAETRETLQQAGFVLVEDYDPAHEHPRHKVRISKAFHLGVHEVTKGQFAQFVADTQYQTDAERDGQGGRGYASAATFYEQKAEFNWKNTGFTQTDSHPVVNVSWNDASAFCNWLSSKEGREYRLPTEAEWEYACRARTDTHFFTGNALGSLERFANVEDTSYEVRFPKVDFTKYPSFKFNDGWALTSSVGQFKANAFGLFDMHGNVWEWCSDWYAGAYYKTSPAADPQGAFSGSQRVIRGGSWDECARRCRSAHRSSDGPSDRNVTLGFRVALSSVK